MAAGTFSVRFAYEQQAADWGRRAEEHASRALKQDANLAEAHLALASAAGTLYRNFDWPTVIREAQVALTLNPNLDLAHSALARAFYHVGLLDWSEAESQRAEETSGGTNVEVEPRALCTTSCSRGHFDEAQQMAETLVEANQCAGHPAVPRPGVVLPAATGRGPRTCSRRCVGPMAASTRDRRRRWRVCSPRTAAATTPRRRIRAVLESGYMDHHVAYALGAAEAQLGRPAEAVKWLRSAADTGFPCYQWMERDTLLDPIR